MFTAVNIFAIFTAGCFFTWFMIGPIMEGMFDWFDSADLALTLLSIMFVPIIAFLLCFFCWPLVLLVSFAWRRI